MIVAVPGRDAGHDSRCATVAIAVLLVDHVIARPGEHAAAPVERLRLSVAVCPAVTLAVGGVTVTVATGAPVTVTVAVPLLPSLDAVIVAVPTLSALTGRVLETTATASSLELHPTRRPGSSAPDASRTLAESCT